MHPIGTVIYFDPFYFYDGTSKPKYFVVLGTKEETHIVASLPTRSCSVPSQLKVAHGCINDDAINFNCYHFEKRKVVTDTGWGFPMPCYLYGANIDDYAIDLLKDLYKEGKDYEVGGILLKQEITDILECFQKSKAVKKKYIPIIEQSISEISKTQNEELPN